MQLLREFLEYLAERPLLEAALIIVLSFVVAKVVDRLLAFSLSRWFQRTKVSFDEVIFEALRGPVVKSVVLFGLGLAARRLELQPSQDLFVTRALATTAIVIWTVFAFRLTSILLRSASETEARFSAFKPQTYPLFDNLGKLLIIGGVTYWLFQVWDLDPSGWLASAGVVGIAVGFAARESLANIFAGVFIIADAPYRVGDFIVLESGERGQVKEIGLRSTRLLTRDDIEITVPNALIGNSKIINEAGGPSPKFRVRVKVGVAYGSDIDLVRKVLLEVVEAVPEVCETPEPRVRFRAFGESGLDFELLCWIPEPVMRGRVLDELNGAVYKRFGQEGIEIPYPKRDVYVHGLAGVTGTKDGGA